MLKYKWFQDLSEFEQHQVMEIRKKMPQLEDREFDIYITLYSTIEQVTEKNTNQMSFKTNLHEVCNRDIKTLETIYYTVCKECLLPLDPSIDVTGKQAYERFRTIGDLFDYIKEKPHF